MVRALSRQPCCQQRFSQSSASPQSHLHTPNDTYVGDVHAQHWQLVSIQREEKLKEKRDVLVRAAGNSCVKMSSSWLALLCLRMPVFLAPPCLRIAVTVALSFVISLTFVC